MLTTEGYSKFVQVARMANMEKKVYFLRDLVQQLPPVHYRTLEFLVAHLCRVAAMSDVNKVGWEKVDVRFIDATSHTVFGGGGSLANRWRCGTLRLCLDQLSCGLAKSR